ncbi:MAG: hypothetical protein Ct9H300mP16_04730 [Pseudomonadota bacterium]|nr:MAG: hypothetical protein Ct9H300mP16_04730 [Pseudomonadota bacterium]
MSGQRGRGTSGAHRPRARTVLLWAVEVMKDGTQPMTGEFREVNTDRTALAFGDDTDRCAPFHTAQAEHPGERINPLPLQSCRSASFYLVLSGPAKTDDPRINKPGRQP